MDPVVPMERWPGKRGRPGRAVAASRLVGAALLVCLAVLGTAGVDLYTDLLWFESLGYRGVYGTILGTQVALFLGAAALFMVGYFPSVLVARRLAHRFEYLAPTDEDGLWAYIARVGARVGHQGGYGRLINVGIALLGGLLAIVMGLLASGQWPLVVRFLYGTPFELVDPIFGQDAGFYVFSLPFLRALHSWLLGTTILIATTTLAVYAVVTAYELGVSLERVVFRMPRPIMLHVAILGALFMVLVAGNHVLDLYELVYSTRGVAFGPGYADVRAEMPALYIMTAVALLAAALIVASALVRSLRPALSGLGLWGLVALLGGLIFPNVVENFEVKPNQLEKERPYLENGIAFTRRAYGLDQIQEQFYPADDSVTAEDVRASPETIRNIRLWDHRPLRDTYNQVQSFRGYYTFEDVDVDRYTLRDGYRQVMVAARELAPERLQPQARTWVNQRLKFTHGHGVTMSLVAAVGEEGRPQFVVQDVPPIGEIPIVRPEIYYGARPSSYAIVRSNEGEFDFPRGDENVETRHQGNTGVNIGNLGRRLAYAIRFRDGNILLSGALRPESEILYRRSIRERVERIAPFLMLDSDPYIVVVDGQLFWMLDAYTHTDAFPYSQPYVRRPAGPRLNYIRNSVKVVMNAYDGSVQLYVADADDPLVRAYRQAFPELLRPFAEMPPALRQHIRYPEDLFRIQADRLQTFHMQDPNVFYNREDVWAIPNEKFYGDTRPVDPYYVIMRLPGQAREEFLLMQPFTPDRRDNMIAWLAARADEANYGKLLLYKFPKDRLVYGPFQVEGRIDQDPSISAQFTLWNQAGSSIIRGNLLVIPLGTSNLYVEPIFLQANSGTQANAAAQGGSGAIPELKRVIVSTGNRLVMEPTLEEALLRLFGPGSAVQTGLPSATAPGAGPDTRTGAAPAPATGPAPPPEVAALVRSANDHFARAQEALRNGDFARYGEEQRALESDLRRLNELTGR